MDLWIATFILLNIQADNSFPFLFLCGIKISCQTLQSLRYRIDPSEHVIVCCFATFMQLLRDIAVENVVWIEKSACVVG